MAYSIFSNIPSLYPKGASGIPLVMAVKMSPDIAKCSRVWKEGIILSGKLLIYRIKPQAQGLYPFAPSFPDSTLITHHQHSPKCRAPKKPPPSCPPVTHSGLWSLFNSNTLPLLYISHHLVLSHTSLSFQTLTSGNHRPFLSTCH